MKVISLLFLLTSCAMVTVKTQKLDLSNYRVKKEFYHKPIQNLKSTKNISSEIIINIENQLKNIQVFENSGNAPKDIFCHTKLSGTSEPLYKPEIIYNKMKVDTARLNADILIKTGSKTELNGAITALTPSIGLSTIIKDKYVYGIACDKLPNKLGVYIDFSSGKITYIKKNSILKGLGIKEQMTILAINEKPLINNPLTVLLEVDSKSKNSLIKLEFLDLKGIKQSKEFNLN